MRLLGPTAWAVLIGLSVAPSSGHAQETQWWTDEEIAAWIDSMEDAIGLADFVDEGDGRVRAQRRQKSSITA